MPELTTLEKILGYIIELRFPDVSIRTVYLMRRAHGIDRDPAGTMTYKFQARMPAFRGLNISHSLMH